MDIALIIILVVLGLAVGVPLGTMMFTDFKHALPPGKDDRNALPPGDGSDVQYEVYDEATGTYSIVSSIVEDDLSAHSSLIKIPSSANGNLVRVTKRDLALITSSVSPVRLRKEAFADQVSSFERCTKSLDASLKRAFSEPSLTYDVHASAVSAATDRFWKNVYVGCEVLAHFDTGAYQKLESDLARSERLMFDSFDSEVLASQIREALDDGVFDDLDQDEQDKIRVKTDEAKRLAQNGKQLQAREVLSQAKEIVIEKTRETSPVYAKMCEMDESLSEADDLLSQNEDIINELENLSSELRSAGAASRAGKTEDVVAELSRLSDNLGKYNI